MGLPWTKLRPLLSPDRAPQTIYERVDGWWMHRIDVTGWHLHNENGAGVAHIFHQAGAPIEAIQVIANNSILYAQFRGMGHPQPEAWRRNDGKTNGTPPLIAA